MSAYNYNKSPGNDSKSFTLGSVNRQQVMQETNKRRTLLQDNSWIKKRQEEEDKQKDENFGKTILSHYKSQDNLDRDNALEDTKPIHNRFKSDDALDRISLKNTSERGNKAATLERLPWSGSADTENKRQSWTPGNRTTTTTTTEETKRKSWAPSSKASTTTTTTTETKQVTLPTKQDGQKITIYSSEVNTTDKPTRGSLVDSARSRFEKTEEKSKLPPLPVSPPAKTDLRVGEKPKLLPRSPPAKIEERPSYPTNTKLSATEASERRSTGERKQRSQDLDNLIEVSSKKPFGKGTQDLDNLIDIKPTIDKSKNRTQDLDNLINIKKPTSDNSRKSENLDDLIEISRNSRNIRSRDEELSNLIEIRKTEDKPRSQRIDDLIDVTHAANKNKGSQRIDDLIDVTNVANKNKGSQRIDDFIDVTNAANKNNGRRIDDLIDVTNAVNKNKGSQDLDNLIDIAETRIKPQPVSTNNTNVVSRTSTTSYKTSEEVPDSTARRSTTTYKTSEEVSDSPGRRSTTTYKTSEEVPDSSARRSTTTYNISESSSGAPERRTTTNYKVSEHTSDTGRRSPSNYNTANNTSSRRSTENYNSVTQRTTTTYTVNGENVDAPNRSSSYEKSKISSNPSDTYVYTTSYDETRRPPSNMYDENIVSKSIKTVYSTSDRSVIEKDMCTYCRKPLGIEAKMILNDLNICCHATCFKCEACSGPLGDLKAGDSMWIYKQTIHCEPCYFGAREKWLR
ncbi:sciellin isoform X49 [Bombina bombina]|uniref:sciellin isoform X45 n=1 Tax=Bombina bombina TaxID=8345 RepID=UPI00235AF428|nr:sciellin isoform X45 [Bombina bombina]XP_053563877.1 sciellin isoform X46 [Bombina bombina]XP_053563878.1 sciellin isoform X47 [Bombina bombina]XP_053563880.1 sciellin isoform X49 [Bombina bombina]